MNWFKVGSLIWTGCGAAWLVLGVVTSVPECYVVGLGCIGMSYFFHCMAGTS